MVLGPRLDYPVYTKERVKCWRRGIVLGRERSDKMSGIRNKSIAYYFPTKDSLAQFIKKYGGEIVSSKGMGGCYGLAGCDT